MLPTAAPRLLYKFLPQSLLKYPMVSTCICLICKVLYEWICLQFSRLSELTHKSYSIMLIKLMSNEDPHSFTLIMEFGIKFTAFSEIIVGSKLLKWLTTVWGKREASASLKMLFQPHEHMGCVRFVTKRKFHPYKQNCMLLWFLLCSSFYKTPLHVFIKCQELHLISTPKTELILEVPWNTSLKIKWKCQSAVKPCIFLEYKYLEVIHVCLFRARNFF